MKNPLLICIAALLTLATAAPGIAKDKDKDKEKDKDRERTVYVTRDGNRYTLDRDGNRHWLEDRRDEDRREFRGDRTRTIYVIERDRPVERVVYLDRDGNYYRLIDGRRVYVRERYFEDYPSKYYYPDGRRRFTITLPF